MSPKEFEIATEKMTTAELVSLVAVQSQIYDADRGGRDGEAETLRDQFTAALNSAIKRKIVGEKSP